MNRHQGAANSELAAGAVWYCAVNGLPSPRSAARPVLACPVLGQKIAAAYEAAPVFQSAAKPAYAALQGLGKVALSGC